MTTTLLLALFGLTFHAPYVMALTSDSSGQGVVYYFGFEIPRITGIPEEQIQDYGCVYGIDQGQFTAVLHKAEAQDKLRYKKSDVRAKVVLPDGSEYFVNGEGVVRWNDSWFILDKKRFVGLLTLASPGRCR